MRYIRQEIFREMGKKGQEILKNSCVAIVGLGALGSVSAQLLARAGVGKLALIDRDIVELSNLQRQSLFDENDIGKAKAAQAKEHLNRINSEIIVDFFIDDLNFENISEIFSRGKAFDLILDCTDNLETRFLINDFCIKNRIPFIYASAVGSKGYIFNIIPNKNSPCLRCFLKEAARLDTCEAFGVLNTATSAIASIQADEAIKILAKKTNFETKLVFFDIWKNELSKLKVSKNRNCECCAKNNFEYLAGKKSSRIVKLCGDNIYQIKSKTIKKRQFNALKNKLKRIGKIIDFGYCINFSNKLTMFEDGRALIKAGNEREARAFYSKFVGN